jgi:hypothetical protein
VTLELPRLLGRCPTPLKRKQDTDNCEIPGLKTGFFWQQSRLQKFLSIITKFVRRLVITQINYRGKRDSHTIIKMRRNFPVL